MTRIDYIEAAERDYPNGYSDYINDNFIIKSFMDMPEWDKNKLWVFLAHVEKVSAE